MTQDGRLAHSLIDAILARLPHATGIDLRTLDDDKVVVSTRATLVEVSKYSINTVLRRLVSTLDVFSKRDRSLNTHAVYTEQSELLVLELLADCCRAHWACVREIEASASKRNSASRRRNSRHSSTASTLNGDTYNVLKPKDGSLWGSSNGASSGAEHHIVPPSFPDTQVVTTLEVLTEIMAPLPDDYQLPSWSLLEIGPWALPTFKGSQVDSFGPYRAVHARDNRIQRAAADILEYLSACNWSAVFNFIQSRLRGLREAHAARGSTNAAGPVTTSLETEANALQGLQVLAHVWLNGRKLGAIIKELCGCFLSLSTVTQNLIAALLPQTIARWLDNNPAEFVHYHTTEKRLEGGADILFDMSNSMLDDPQRRASLCPLQTALLLLIPDVFRVAGAIGPTKSTSTSKKAAFLEGLRKSLHTSRGSETAAFCLLGLCQIARHFPTNSDSALLNYALDVENEIREEIFDQAVSTESPHDKLPDLHLMIAAFISLSYLDPESVHDNVLPCCFKSNAPVELRLAVFASCNIIAQQPDASRYNPLFMAIGPHMREFLQILPYDRDEVLDELPMGEHSSKEMSKVSERALLHSILDFLTKRPETLFGCMPTSVSQSFEALQEELENIIPLIADEDEMIRSFASTIVHSLTSREFLAALGHDVQASWHASSLYLCRTTATLLSSLSALVLRHVHDETEIKKDIKAINQVLRVRLDFVRSGGDISKTAEVSVDSPERSNASTDLEVAFLVLLSSSHLEVGVAATGCLAVYCEEISVVETLTELTPSSLSFTRNFDAYAELCAPNFRLTGMVAFQKRFRKCLAKMTTPSTGILAAWETVFAQWSEMNGRILATESEQEHTSSEKFFTEWRNYSGLLASIGGCCIADTTQTAPVDESMVVGLRWIDRPSPDGGGQSLLNSFLSQCLQLLFCSNVLVRENTREVLGVELNPKLFPCLLRSLQSALEGMFENSSMQSTPQTGAVVLEQTALLLKAMVERQQDVGDPAFPTDFESICLHLSQYADRLHPDLAMLRARIRVCHLCTSVTQQRHAMNLGQAIRIRNQLLHITFGWISRLGLAQLDNIIANSGQRVDEVIRHQRDLNRACLQAVVNLTYRLPLQPSTDQADMDSFEPKTQLFLDYFKGLLSLLEDESSQVERSHEHPFASFRTEDCSSAMDLTIAALSNLLSANVDVGLKHALHMGYHENVQVRTAFLRVLCNILSQEADFERLSDAALAQKYKGLLDAITRDMALVVVLCDSCSSSQIDELAISLLNVFESRGMGFQLLKTLIKHEVETTDSETELLRRHCVTTKMLSAYARWNGRDYLRSTIQQTIKRLMQASDELNLELDPTRAGSPEELHRNAAQLQRVTKTFIDEICRSADRVPPTFRRICHTIGDAVTPRFPEAKFTAVGAFIFLRFFCPAIVAPEAEGLIITTPSKEMRRGLLLIAKVVQNLANNVLFGAKEQYMSPLNNFLAQNIYRVTAFLRDISAQPPIIEQEPVAEAFDFGSSVILHRFFFDHWDIVRQKLVALERRSWGSHKADTEADPASTQKTTSLSVLSELIPSLGTPQIDISWKSPQPAANTPQTYSRFQEFMFKNVRKHGESITSLRAIYDGGHSRDDLPIICIVLRAMEQEEIDLDLLLFTFFKIASRMWHRQFGVLIDVTCYRGLLTTADEMIYKVNSLSPSEVTRNLTRIYIYNMNSVYRKCFRRVMRPISKDPSNIFHASNVDYFLVGSLKELQTHFNLGSLQLPKETISVVTDSRFAFQPVTRLSRTKDKREVDIKTEVDIKIGSQYVQITTTHKQDLGPGSRLSGIVNDIFRITDIEEAKAPIYVKEETAFGLRIENGKFFMYFVSPRKADVLQALRAAKAKNRKEFKPASSVDRLIRPDDVPGSLLNIALMNLASSDRALRLASYNAISGLSRSFRFETTDRRLITATEVYIPANSGVIVRAVSEKLAVSEPRLTHDFLSEFFIGWEKLTSEERPLSIVYMSPWLANLERHIMYAEVDCEKGKEKAAAIARKLVETALRSPGCRTCFQEHVWTAVAKEDALTDIFLDEIVKVALEVGVDSSEIPLVAAMAASIGTMSIQGKIISRLRKALHRSSSRPTHSLADNEVWDEIRVLLRLCLKASFESRGQSQLFLPEIFYIATMTLYGGSPTTSACIHGLLINTVHALCTTFPLSEARLAKLKTVLISLTDPKVEVMFDLHRVAGASEFSPSEKTAPDTAMFSHLEGLTQLLSSVIELGAPSKNLANVWRARWMSLVASTAFQFNPAIQSKAFTVMGCLATEDVDDDLLYQVLVSLRTGVRRFVDAGDGELLISVITTLTKMAANLSSSSRYIKQLFWLAVSLVRLVPLALFSCAASLLEAVVQVLAVRGAFVKFHMASVLIQGRLAAELTEPILSELDEKFEIRFAPQNFHVALTLTLLKGLTEPTTHATTVRVFSSMLEISSRSATLNDSSAMEVAMLPYILLLGTRATNVEERRAILWLARRSSQVGTPSPTDLWAMVELDHIGDRELLCHIIPIVVNFEQSEDMVQQHTLEFFIRLANQRPSVVMLLIDPLTFILSQILTSSQSSGTLEAAHSLMGIIARESQWFSASEKTGNLDSILSSAGLEGIWKSSTFDDDLTQRKECGVLVETLIKELIIH